MVEWKKATKTVEYREPEPNAHEWKYAGRTPQGGLSGGDDVHECQLCGGDSFTNRWNDRCRKGANGKTEIVELTPNRYDSKKERAVVGKHIIIKDEEGVQVILKVNFQKYYEVLPEPDLICNVCGKLVYCISYCPRCGGGACDDCFDVDSDLCNKCLQEQ